MLVKELKGVEVMSGGVGGGDMRRNVLLRDEQEGGERRLGEIM